MVFLCLQSLLHVCARGPIVSFSVHDCLFEVTDGSRLLIGYYKSIKQMTVSTECRIGVVLLRFILQIRLHTSSNKPKPAPGGTTADQELRGKQKTTGTSRQNSARVLQVLLD